ENAQPMSDSPLEAMLSLKGQTGDHLSWTLAGSSALSESVGAPTWRILGGIDVAFGARNQSDCESCVGSVIRGGGIFDSNGQEIDGRVHMVRFPDGKSMDITEELSWLEDGG